MKNLLSRIELQYKKIYSVIKPTEYKYYSLSLIHRPLYKNGNQHIHQSKVVYQPIINYAMYRGYLQKSLVMQRQCYNKPEYFKIQLQSILKSPTIVKELSPFYKTIWQSMIDEEQHYYRSRPTQSLGLLGPLLSHRQTFALLTKFYLGQVKKDDVMKYSTAITKPFYTWQLLRHASYPILPMLSSVTQKAPKQEEDSMLYIYPSQKGTKELTKTPSLANQEANQITKTIVDKAPLQSTITTTQNISAQEIKQIVNQVTRQIEKQYRYEAKRYGRKV